MSVFELASEADVDKQSGFGISMLVSVGLSASDSLFSHPSCLSGLGHNLQDPIVEGVRITNEAKSSLSPDLRSRHSRKQKFAESKGLSNLLLQPWFVDVAELQGSLIQACPWCQAPLCHRKSPS